MATITGRRTINTIKVLEIDSDPSLGGGVSAAIGTIASATDGSGIYVKTSASDTSWIIASSGGGGSGANTALSNLITTTINTSLIPAINDGYDIGSSTKEWKDGYVANVGTNSSTPLILFSNNTERARASTSEFVINENSIDYDFRVEGSGTRSNLLLVDAGTARVGVNRVAGTHGATLDIDNLAVAESIFIARDNTTAVVTIADGGDSTFAPVSGHTGHALTITGGTLATTKKVVSVTANLPSTNVFESGFAVNITSNASAGTSAFPTGGIIQLDAGYTGPGATLGFEGATTVAGTGANVFDINNFWGAANYGMAGASATASTVGHNIGILGIAQTSTTLNVGVLGKAANTATSGEMMAVAGQAIIVPAVTNRTAGFFFLTSNTVQYTPTITGSGAALIADNGNVALPIFRARDNGTSVVTIADGGQMQSQDGSSPSPQYSFASDTNVGMYRITTDVLGFATAGSERVRISSDGYVGIGKTPVVPLDVNGNIKLSSIANLTASTSGAGTMRFTSDGYFQISDGIIWGNIDYGDIGYKTLDESVSSSIVAQDDDQLIVNLLASSKYSISGTLFMNEVNSGMRLTLDGTSTATSFKARIAIYDTQLRATGTITSFGSEITHNTTGGGQHHVVVDGSVETNTGGTLLMKWAQNTSDPAALTMQRNSFLKVTRIYSK